MDMPVLPTLWTALWFLLPVVPISIWVSWSDLRSMKIPNKAVLATAAAYLVIGPIALPFTMWLWGWALGAGVLVAGFIATSAGFVGAGDSKFAAAMAPFFIGGDARFILALFAGCLLAAFATHRIFGRIPAFRRATADWESWTHKDFPMGLALSGTFVFYFVLALLFSA
nr:prepilin peptidase [Gemmobacter straminiformis]